MAACRARRAASCRRIHALDSRSGISYPACVGTVRPLLARYPGLACLLVALALLMKAWVPVGYMPATVDGRLLLALCSGSGAVSMQGMPIAGTIHDLGQPDPAAQHADSPCLFSGLSSPLLPGACPLLLAAAIFFLFVAALRFQPLPPIRRAAYLRPPAQAPPAFR